MIGTVVGSYRVTGTIGGGGMGMIYRAEHNLIGKPAAVKVLLPDFARNREIVNRFFNEAKAATAIQHPGIVEIFDFGYLPDGSAFIVMEFLPGESLASRIRARGRVSETEANAIIRGITSALGAAHAKGIVHRDIKPDNVFLVPDPEMPAGERVKLLDFGIAKLADEHTGGWSQTRTGAMMGTPTYMAPEQCAGAGKVDARADLYAVGCILFELLAGRPPFVGDGAGEVIGQHQYVAAPPLRSMAPEASLASEDLVGRLLSKHPDQRPQSAADVLRALGSRSAVISTGSQAQVTVARAGVISPQTTLTSAAGANLGSWSGAPPRSRRGLVIGTAAAVAVAAVLVIAIVVGSSKNEKSSGAGVSPKVEQPTPAGAPAVVEPPAPAPAPAAVVEPPAPTPAAVEPSAPAPIAVDPAARAAAQPSAPAPIANEPTAIAKPVEKATEKPTATATASKPEQKKPPRKPKPAATGTERPRTEVVDDL